MGMYFAIEFEKPIINKLNQRQVLLKQNSVSGDWSDKETFHITVLYAGKDIVDRKQYMDALDKLKEKFTPQPFDLKMQNYGFFGEGDKRVAWVGVKDSLPLYQLKYDLESILKENNAPVEKSRFNGYTPHITMGYDVEVNEGFNTQFEDDTTMTVQSLCLWDSYKANDTYITNKIYEVKF